MLDAQAGVEYEGEHPPEQDEHDSLAIRAANYLANGQGGIDWAGLPIVCAHLGITDHAALMDRLLVIKLHRPPRSEAGD